MKTEVYSWRLSPELKSALEEAADEQGSSLADLLEGMARPWLERRAAGEGQDEELLRRRASRFVGCLEGADPHRAERAHALVTEKLRRRREVEPH